MEGDGRTEIIQVRQNENTLSHAKNFCHKYCLNEDIVNVLNDFILSNLHSPSPPKNSKIKTSNSKENVIQYSPVVLENHCQGKRRESLSVNHQSMQNLFQKESPKRCSSKKSIGKENIANWSKSLYQFLKVNNSKINEKTSINSHTFVYCFPDQESFENWYKNESKRNKAKIKSFIHKADQIIHTSNHRQIQKTNKSRSPSKDHQRYGLSELSNINQMDNVGSKLFYLAEHKRKVKEDFLQKYHQEKNKIEAEQYSFKPIINDKSQKMINKEQYQKKLNERRETDQIKQKEFQMEQKALEERECTFQPEINRKSAHLAQFQRNKRKNNLRKFNNDHENSRNYIVDSQSINDELFHSLYAEANVINLKKQEKAKEIFDREFTFHPKLISKMRPRAISQERKRSLERNENPQIDNSNSARKRRRSTQKCKENLENKQENYEHYLSKFGKIDLSKMSLLEKITELKKLRLQELFQSFDHDNDGIISHKNLNLSNLSSKTVISLHPLIYKIQQNKLNLNFKTFCEEVNELDLF